jgi:hypothetical protein
MNLERLYAYAAQSFPLLAGLAIQTKPESSTCTKITASDDQKPDLPENIRR